MNDPEPKTSFQTRIIWLTDKFIYPLVAVLVARHAYASLSFTSPLKSWTLLINTIVILFLWFSPSPTAVRLTFKTLFSNILAFLPLAVPFDFLHPIFDGWNGSALMVTLCFYYLWIVISYLYLGRNIGILPSLKKISTNGTFHYLRHPIYSGWLHLEILISVSFPSWRNLIVVLCVFAGTLMKIQEEETVMSLDSEYQIYKQNVRFKIFRPLIAAPILIYVFICLCHELQKTSNLVDTLLKVIR